MQLTQAHALVQEKQFPLALLAVRTSFHVQS